MWQLSNTIKLGYAIKVIKKIRMPCVLHPENPPLIKVIVTFRTVPWGQGHARPENQPETKLERSSLEHHKSYV